VWGTQLNELGVMGAGVPLYFKFLVRPSWTRVLVVFAAVSVCVLECMGACVCVCFVFVVVFVSRRLSPHYSLIPRSTHMHHTRRVNHRSMPQPPLAS